MSYSRTYASVGADPAPTTTTLSAMVGMPASTQPSLWNLIGMNKPIQIKKNDGLPIWVWVGGAGVLALGLFGGARLWRKRKKATP